MISQSETVYGAYRVPSRYGDSSRLGDRVLTRSFFQEKLDSKKVLLERGIAIGLDLLIAINRDIASDRDKRREQIRTDCNAHHWNQPSHSDAHHRNQLDDSDAHHTTAPYN